MTYQEQLDDVAARMGRLVDKTDPVAVSRRMGRLGMDQSPEEVAKVVSYLDPKSKTPSKPVKEEVDNG